jgi:ribosomal protein L11 methyltransferase
MIRLAVRVRREQAELVLAELLDLAPAGVEEVDFGESIEYAVYGAPGELPSLPDVRAVAGTALVDVCTSELEDDWPERWKRFHRPVLVGAPSAPAAVPSLRVAPPWAAPSRAEGRAVTELVIDPGQAFGTGAHPTTRLCLELLLELAATGSERGAVLDVGTGSGVLAIAAALLGFSPVLGVDNEGESIRAAEANAERNGVQIELRRADLRDGELPRPEPANAPRLITANLLRPLLLELARTLPGAPRELIAGGLLVGEADEVAEAFSARLGLRELARRQAGDWSALLLSSVSA